MNSISKYLSTGGTLLFLILTYAGMLNYSGSLLIFGAFSIFSFLLVLDAIFRPAGISYSFLVLFLSLGFWVKIMLHLWLGYDYLEPIGNFDHSPASWNQALIVSTFGLCGVMLGKAFFQRYLKLPYNLTAQPPAPYWYPSVRPWLWVISFVAIIGIPCLNWIYGLAQIGITPATLLPWPINGLVAWLLGFGLIAWVLTLAGWDQAENRHWCIGYIATILEGSLSSASCLSRATYIFHTIPYLMVLYAGRARVKLYRNCILVLTAWIIFFLVSLVLVMGLRYGNGSPIQASSHQGLNISEPTEFVPKLAEKISLLVVDRWIGIEGVMATIAYPDKSMALLEFASRERRIRGQLDFYTSNIALVKLSDEEKKLFQYASIPGGIAFFYYSDSLLLVLLGMSGLAIILIGSERLVLLMTRNPYLCAFWGMGAAQTVASFGLGIAQQLVYSGFCLLVLGCIGLIQRTSAKRKPAQV
jgi:hypothetical protein